MKTHLQGAARGLLVLVLVYLPCFVPAQTDTAKIVTVADNFLAALTPEQRQKRPLLLR
jgi:hypothetical protein